MAAFADFGMTAVIEAMGTPRSYLEFAAARRDLSSSPAGCRSTLDRFRA